MVFRDKKGKLQVLPVELIVEEVLLRCSPRFTALSFNMSMTKIIVCTFLPVFFYINLGAQQPKDNAVSEQGSAATLKAKLKTANDFLLSNQSKPGIETLQKMRPAIIPATDIRLKSEYYWLLGELFYKSKNYAELAKAADTLLALHSSRSDTLWVVKGLVQKAFGLLHQTKLAEATDHFKEVINLSVSIANKYYQAKGYHGIGAVAFQGRQIAEVKKQFKRAIEIYAVAGFEEEAATLTCSLSRTFVAESNIYIDSAFYWNNQAKPVGDKYPKNLELNYIIWQNEADYFARSGDFSKADKAFARAEAIALQMPGKYSLGGLLQIKSYAALNAGKMEEALKIAAASKDIFVEMGDFAMLKKSFQLLYVINEEKGDYRSAYEALNEYVDISDSILTHQSMAQINDLNIRYETAEKEKQIAEQELQIDKKNSRLRNMVFTLLAAALVIGLLLLLYYQRRKNYQQSLVSLRKEQDISLLKALMTGEEKERNRLARELHDGLGGLLAAAQMQVSNVETNNDQVSVDNKLKAVQLVSQAANESRRIAHNLLPETLLRFGLDEALREYCNSISVSKLLQLNYESVGMQHQLGQPAALSIYRIIQELVNNIIKHAGATEAMIQLHQDKGKLAITVEDNGNGFAPHQQGKAGIGLSNIQSRVYYLNGSLDIRSEEKKGTSVYIEIQLDKNAA